MSCIIPKRRIELKIKKETSSSVSFTIIKQSHRAENFNPIGYEETTVWHGEFPITQARSFSCPDSKYIIASYSFPQNRSDLKILYVRGDDDDADNNTVVASRSDFEEIKKVIDAYNTTFEKDIVINEGDSYSYYSKRGNIIYDILTNSQFKGRCIYRED